MSEIVRVTVKIHASLSLTVSVLDILILFSTVFYDQEVLFQITIINSLNETSITFAETLKLKKNCLFKYYVCSDTCVN